MFSYLRSPHYIVSSRHFAPFKMVQRDVVLSGGSGRSAIEEKVAQTLASLNSVIVYK